MSAIESSPERELYRPPRVMTKQEKLEEIRKMKDSLHGGPKENESK